MILDKVDQAVESATRAAMDFVADHTILSVLIVVILLGTFWWKTFPTWPERRK